MGKGSGKGGGGGAGGGGRAVEGAQPEQDPTTWEPDLKYEKDYDDDPDANPGGVVKGPGQDLNPYDTPTEITDSIIAYTGGKVDGGERFAHLNAEKLNEALYNPTKFLSEEGPQMMGKAKAFAKELNTSLSKVRDYAGETYRVIMDSGGAVADKFKVGKTYVSDHFFSTSRSVKPSYRAFIEGRDNQTRFIVKGKRGKMVENISNYMDEKEVIYRLKTKFHVESKNFNYSRNTWDIVLREI